MRQPWLPGLMLALCASEGAAPPPAGRPADDSIGASSTPACDGERIFISFPNKDAITTTALSREGKILLGEKP